MKTVSLTGREASGLHSHAHFDKLNERERGNEKTNRLTDQQTIYDFHINGHALRQAQGTTKYESFPVGDTVLSRTNRPTGPTDQQTIYDFHINNSLKKGGCP